MKKTQKGNVAVIALIIVIVAITAGVIGYLFAKRVQNPVVSQSSSVISEQKQIQQQVQPSDETADWQTYSSVKYGFEFKYPKNYTLSVNDQTPNFYQVSFMDKDDVVFYVKVDISEKKDASGYHLDNESVGKTTLGGNEANKFVLEKGYCDGPGCSPVIVALKTYYNGLNYVVNFYGTTEISGVNEKILSTFKFTDATVEKSSITPVQIVGELLSAEQKKANPEIGIVSASDKHIKATLFFNPGGYVILAANVDGKWKKVFEGNGIPKCSEIAQYEFPKNVADCSDME